MAIAFGGSSNNFHTVTGTSLSYTGPTVSGSNVFGIVFFMTNGASPAVTWNGVSMNLLSTTLTAPEGGSNVFYIFTLAGVTTGNIVGSVNASSQINLHDAYYTGVAGGLDTATPTTNTSGSATSLTVSITPNADSCWVIGALGAQDVPGIGVSAGAGTTKRNADTDDHNIFDNNAAVSPAASTTLTWTQSLASPMGGIAFAISPTAATSPRASVRMLTGIGM